MSFNWLCLGIIVFVRFKSGLGLNPPSVGSISSESFFKMLTSRRQVLEHGLKHSLLLGFVDTASSSEDYFESAGYGREEYTNSIVASRDTNISPKEVYDTLSKLQISTGGGRALDVGAGAGVSTQVLWNMGYHNIDALDWSGEAWRINVDENGHCPVSVHFYELDDERFLQQWHRTPNAERYDVIAFNFAVNRNKAMLFCKELLKHNGILLAPINVQSDYWLKQVYTLLDSSGKTLWSANDVGAWSVQFQPDVTQDTCQGVWCAPFNGFQKLKQ
jgi:protein-L-isoaspartate O-methyltransferase